MSKNKLRILAMCLGIFITMLDTTIMNVALPSIKISLNTNLHSLSWALNAYTIAFAALSIPLGKLANIYGKKIFYIVALSFFGIGSILSGMSDTVILLVISRVIQSIGAALLFPLSMDLAISTQNENLKKKATLFVGISQGGAAAAGPILGGIITQYLGWRYIFFVNIPIVFIALILSLYALPKNIEKESAKVDWVGAVLVMVNLVMGTLLITQYRTWGFSKATIICLIVLGFSLPLFFIVEQKKKDPIINFHLFKYKEFNISTLATILGQFFLVGFMVIMPTFLTTVFKYSEFYSALLIIPTTLTIFLVAPFSGNIVSKRNGGFLISLGFVLISIGYFMLGCINSPLNYYIYIGGSILIGAGYGLIVGPVSVLSTIKFKGSLLTTSQSVIGILRQIGTVLAVSIFISLLNSNLSHIKLPNDVFRSFSSLFLYFSPFILCLSYLLFLFKGKKRSI